MNALLHEVCTMISNLLMSLSYVLDQIRKYRVKYTKTKVKPNNKEFASYQDESHTFFKFSVPVPTLISDLCIKQLSVRQVFLFFVHTWSWNQSEFNRFTHPENKIRSIISLAQEVIFTSFLWNSTLRAQYCFLSLRISYLNFMTPITTDDQKVF